MAGQIAIARFMENFMKHLKRFIIDSVGNYLFFAPLVIFFTPALHTLRGAEGYLLAAVPITLIGARGYMLFSKYVWYPLFKEDF